MPGKVVASMTIAAFAVSSAKAEDFTWHGKLTSGYLLPDADVKSIGTTESAYGGSPRFNMDDGGQIAFALGRKLPDGWRIEGELTLLRLNTDSGAVTGFDDRLDDSFRLDGKVDSAVLMVNGLFDLHGGETRFKPYLKAGIGIARNEASATMDVQYEAAMWTGTVFEGQSVSGVPFPGTFETSFAWNVGLGIRTRLTEHFLLSLEYGFIDLGEAATGTNGANDAIVWRGLTSQRALLGLDFRF